MALLKRGFRVTFITSVSQNEFRVDGAVELDLYPFFIAQNCFAPLKKLAFLIAFTKHTVKNKIIYCGLGNFEQ